MAKKIDADTMVRSLGAGTALLNALMCEVVRQKGDPESLIFLTHDRFRKNLEFIASSIVGCDWRVAESYIKALTKKERMKQFACTTSAAEAEMDNLLLYLACEKLGIPFENYSNDADSSEPGIPLRMLQELNGKVMTYPFTFMVSPTKTVIVVNWATKSGRIYMPGDRIDSGDIGILGVTDYYKYFDPTK